MPYKVSFSTEANSDVDSILFYIAADSPATALNFVDRLESRIVELLSLTPSAGKRIGRARYFSFGNYVVAYIVNEEASTVTVVLVAEGHRNWRADLDDRLPS
ncbi:type II toxin-antitoxin system RelE/ParE family toxin [Mesorhizobium sp. J428]|uniref:type II toxin-antitoxin system RelE/ParE family toxin n=1 Tax=Mesorhizobium sp. J428 TaxID=2898440 RepID=UPI0021511CB2|nr:type II toxin-antitoxin system RelE/ParE family toxin [Mesorhizobium sp. J428]MCR5855924.1 type II toxin-antitoxin system RelE/ParE family toxin [Mesorhizobium sp. J428]